jgi:hypothetical protein
VTLEVFALTPYYCSKLMSRVEWSRRAAKHSGNHHRADSQLWGADRRPVPVNNPCSWRSALARSPLGVTHTCGERINRQPGQRAISDRTSSGHRENTPLAFTNTVVVAGEKYEKVLSNRKTWRRVGWVFESLPEPHSTGQ